METRVIELRRLLDINKKRKEQIENYQRQLNSSSFDWWVKKETLHFLRGKIAGLRLALDILE